MARGGRSPAALRGRSSLAGRRSVVVDRSGAFEVFEENRLDVEAELDLVADHAAAVRELVLPGDAEVVAVDPGGGLETDAAHLAPVLVSLPPRRLPLAEVLDIERDGFGHAANRQLDFALEGGVAGALCEAALEADLGVVVDVEEVGGAQVLVAHRLARPELGGVD